MIRQSSSDTATAGPGALDLQVFCESVLRMDGKPVRFTRRPHLDEIYRATSRNLVIRAGRQVEKTSYICFRICFELMRPGTRVLLVCPRESQAIQLMKTRLMRLFEESPILRECLRIPRGRLNPKTICFGNGSQLFVRSAFNSADAARGTSADVLICDEFQDLAARQLPVLTETLAHSERPITILTGTSKEVTNHLEDAFARSTARAWTVRCPECGTDVVPDERSIGPSHYRCHRCESPIDWQCGRWVATNPHADWGEGFWLPQIITTWGALPRYQEKARNYDHDRLLNEVFGLPTMHGTLAITRGELEACCSARRMARSFGEVSRDAQGSLLLGVDWGSGLTGEAAVAIASVCHRSQRLRVWYWAMVGGPGQRTIDKVEQLCNRFAVRWVFADARGGGAHRNRELHLRLGGGGSTVITGVEYGDHDVKCKKDGCVLRWTLDKTKWVAGLCARVREKRVEFPTSADCELGFSHFASEQVAYDAESRVSRYHAADGRSDDLLHPIVYLVAGITLASGRAGLVEVDVPDDFIDGL